MKIFENEERTVNVGHSIDDIIRRLNTTKFIMGDKTKQIHNLKYVKSLIDKLIDGLSDENANIVYFSGSSKEFLSSRKEVK